VVVVEVVVVDVVAGMVTVDGDDSGTKVVVGAEAADEQPATISTTAAVAGTTDLIRCIITQRA
jgi:hypothetical protein